MGKRGENIRRRTDGRWEGRYTLLALEGKQTYSVYGKSYTEVKEKLVLAKEKAKRNHLLVLSGQDPVRQDTFEALAMEWLRYIQQKRKYSTYVKYKDIYERYLEQLDKVCMEQLDEDVVNEHLTRLGIKDSQSLRQSVYAVLNQIIRYANRMHGFHLSAYKWEAETEKKKGIEVFNQTEQVRLLSVLYRNTDIYKAGIILCLSTGLRLGEICSLKWQDIDMQMKVLHVNSTVQRITVDGYDTKSILLESGPKSDHSIREIPLSDDIIQLLQSFPSGGRYILNVDRPMEPRTYQYKLKSYLKEAGVQDRNFHALRHTFATNCMESGMDVKSLSEILGHADVKITLNRYVHPSIDIKRYHMNSLSAVYGQKMGRKDREPQAAPLG